MIETWIICNWCCAFWFNSFTYLTNFIQVGHDDGQKFFSNALNMINDVLNLNLRFYSFFFTLPKWVSLLPTYPTSFLQPVVKISISFFFIISLLTIFLTSWFEIALWWRKAENITNRPIDYQKPKGINRSCTLLQLTYRNRKTSY